MIKNISNITLGLFFCLSISGCAGGGAKNIDGIPVIEVPVGGPGPVAGVGIGSHEIIAMSDKMVRDIMATPQLVGRQKAPRVIIDSSDFKNKGSQPINKDLIVDKLRVDLNRAAKGKIRFIGREYAATVAKERDLKREGVTDTGTVGLTKAQKGVDFKLVGSIGTLDSATGSSTGLIQRYTQITFEMLDLEDDELIWSNNYEFERAGAEDVTYR